LIDMREDGRRPRLTVIHAPAGYGKSTLASQWQQALTADGVSAAWLTIDTDDNNVVWFLGHLIEALRRVRPELSQDLGQVLEEHGDRAQQYVLTNLINDIHAGGDRVALILDDWHRVTEPGTIAALGYLLDNGCHHLQFVVTSRTQTGLPLSRLRVRDELVEVGPEALRFAPDESKRFLVDVNGLVLADSEIDRLTASTDGSVAALQPASLSLRDAKDPRLLIDHLSGRHRTIGEYLVENVLDAVEPRILEFLLATSIPAGAGAGSSRAPRPNIGEISRPRSPAVLVPSVSEIFRVPPETEPPNTTAGVANPAVMTRSWARRASSSRGRSNRAGCCACETVTATSSGAGAP
jgi:serine/threonine-protein kinase PknK